MSNTLYVARRGQNTRINDGDWGISAEEWLERDRLFRLSPAYEGYKQKIILLINMFHDVQVEKAIDKNSSEVLEQFTTLTIREGADAKARYLSRRVCDLADESYELSFAVASKKEETGLVVDNLEPYFHQGVLPNRCIDPPKGVQATIHYLNTLNQKLIGWAHSHGHIGPRPSEEDRDRFEKDLLWQGRRIQINQSEENPGGYTVFAMPTLVYNALLTETNQPYAAIVVGYRSRAYPGEFRVFVNRARLNVIKEEVHLDTKTLDDILLERVWCLPPGSPRDLLQLYDFFGTEQFKLGESLKDRWGRKKDG